MIEIFFSENTDHRFICGSAADALSLIDDCSIQCVVTSPPYYRLRDYGHKFQIGLEEEPILYVQKLVEVFNCVKRVLKDNGTLWLNIGDSYAGSGGAGASEEYRKRHKQFGKSNNIVENKSFPIKTFPSIGIKAKDRIGIPWMLVNGLRSNGWYIRQEILWHKPKPKPEGGVRDRPVTTHEHIFLLSKNPKYFYNISLSKQLKIGSVWSIDFNKKTGQHYAMFPEKLPHQCIVLGSSKGDYILDPFAGLCTTGVAAAKTGRNSIMIDVKEEFLKIGMDQLSYTGKNFKIERI